ncbi:hypothetical protein DXV76_11580 [Rhodobacteraceae bacterium CCMM004]|nr:hypothetical protein DXV76_11580 [Rhodobacteraceae bacterium CCMM004]
MVRNAWDLRIAQSKQIVAGGKRQIADLERQIHGLLDRVIEARSPTVIRPYEDKIAKLGRQKLVSAEKLPNQTEPRGSFDDHLEPGLMFLANPWNFFGNRQHPPAPSGAETRLPRSHRIRPKHGSTIRQNSVSVQSFKGSTTAQSLWWCG